MLDPWALHQRGNRWKKRACWAQSLDPDEEVSAERLGLSSNLQQLRHVLTLFLLGRAALQPSRVRLLPPLSLDPHFSPANLVGSLAGSGNTR